MSALTLDKLMRVDALLKEANKKCPRYFIVAPWRYLRVGCGFSPLAIHRGIKAGTIILAKPLPVL